MQTAVYLQPYHKQARCHFFYFTNFSSFKVEALERQSVPAFSTDQSHRTTRFGQCMMWSYNRVVFEDLYASQFYFIFVLTVRS